MESYIISMGITIVLNLLKNEANRRKYKNALLKVANAIIAAFPGDLNVEVKADEQRKNSSD